MCCLGNFLCWGEGLPKLTVLIGYYYDTIIGKKDSDLIETLNNHGHLLSLRNCFLYFCVSFPHPQKFRLCSLHIIFCHSYHRGRLTIYGKRRLTLRRPTAIVRVNGRWRRLVTYRGRWMITYKRRRRIFKTRHARFFIKFNRTYRKISTYSLRHRRRRLRRILRRRRRRVRRRRRRKRRRRRRRRRRRQKRRRRGLRRRRRRRRRGCVMRIRYGRRWRPVYRKRGRLVVRIGNRVRYVR